MSRRQCCVWGCSNKKGKCPEDIFGNRLCDCPLPQNKGCHRGKYLTLHNIHSMPELVKRAVIEKINHTRQGSQRTKWKPSQQAFICNVHYPDFKGPSRVNPDILPIHFKRPTSYPATTIVPKKRKLLERRPPPKKPTRSKIIDAEVCNEQCHKSQPCQNIQQPSEELYSDQYTYHNTETVDDDQHTHDTEMTDSDQHAHLDTEMTDSDQHAHLDTEMTDSDQHAHLDTEMTDSDQHAHLDSEMADSDQHTHDIEMIDDDQHTHDTEMTDSDQHAHHDAEIIDNDLPTPNSMQVFEFTEEGEPDSPTVENLLQKNQELHLENIKLKEHILFLNTHLQRLNLSLLNDSQVNMYTGMSRKVFDCIDRWLQPVTSKQRANETLSPTQKLLLVLMRLRHNHTQSDLACRFNVEQSSVSRILNHWIPLLSAQFNRLIKWPQTCIGPSVAPYDLLPNSVAIIDGTEIFIQRPSNLATQKSSYSDYKSHTTVKFLVAIDTFTGVFIFVSTGFSGNSSDRFTIEHSGILEELKPGQRILADKGYNARDLFAQKRCFLTIPSFLNGGTLAAQEARQSRSIASVRIRVENAIRRIKEYKIVTETLCNRTSKRIVDDIMVVVCALCNLKEKLIK